ncbi:MAG: hypothetical protein R2684_04215 [Pyrinomonadaceae bacterium]
MAVKKKDVFVGASLTVLITALVKVISASFFHTLETRALVESGALVLVALILFGMANGKKKNT